MTRLRPTQRSRQSHRLAHPCARKAKLTVVRSPHSFAQRRAQPQALRDRTRALDHLLMSACASSLLSSSGSTHNRNPTVNRHWRPGVASHRRARASMAWRLFLHRRPQSRRCRPLHRSAEAHVAMTVRPASFTRVVANTISSADTVGPFCVWIDALQISCTLLHCFGTLLTSLLGHGFGSRTRLHTFSTLFCFHHEDPLNEPIPIISSSPMHISTGLFLPPPCTSPLGPLSVYGVISLCYPAPAPSRAPHAVSVLLSNYSVLSSVVHDA